MTPLVTPAQAPFPASPASPTQHNLAGLRDVLAECRPCGPGVRRLDHLARREELTGYWHRHRSRGRHTKRQAPAPTPWSSRGQRRRRSALPCGAVDRMVRDRANSLLLLLATAGTLAQPINDQPMCRNPEFSRRRDRTVCRNPDRIGRSVKVSAHCPITIPRKLTVSAHHLIPDQPTGPRPLPEHHVAARLLPTVRCKKPVPPGRAGQSVCGPTVPNSCTTLIAARGRAVICRGTDPIGVPPLLIAARGRAVIGRGADPIGGPSPAFWLLGCSEPTALTRL